MKITIITATHNSKAFISNCITSIKNQTYKEIEHLIIDGASTDNTVEIIKSTPNRVKLIISEPDKGIYDAINKGISLSSGEIIGLLHSDDIFSDDNTLSCICAEFVKGADVVYGNMNYVKKNNTSVVIRNWISKPLNQANLRYGWMPPHTTFFCLKSVYDKHGLFDLTFKISADYDLMLRILKDNTLKVNHIPVTLVQMRLGGMSNRSFMNILLKMYEDYKAIRKNKIGGLYTLAFKNLRKLPQFILK
jgi:glycosyltransferase